MKAYTNQLLLIIWRKKEMNKGFWVIIENNYKKEIRYFKHRFIKYWIYIIINKIKGNEVSILNGKDI